jgi:hypothetical protein
LDDCTRATPYDANETQMALEVTRDDFRTGSLYPVKNFMGVSHAEDDWFVIHDLGDAVMVNSRGDTRVLTRGRSVDVTEIAGPLVHAGSMAFVDMEARRLHPLEGDGHWDWWGSGDSWFWGSVSLSDESGRVTRQGLSWRNPDGSFDVRMLPVGASRTGFQMPRTGVPGTMAAIDFGWPRLMHVSTDYGATWEVLETPLDGLSGDRLPPDWRTWPRA